MATSSLPTRPRSPCSESTGWRNEAGLPVEVSVAAILRAISPDLPTPETISRPVAFSSSRTAAENAGPRRSATRRIASASRTSTRRPRSASSLGSVRDIATLQEVFREQALPLTPGLEDQLGHLPHRALAAGNSRHHSGCGLQDRKSTRLNSSHGYISYAVFCLKKKKTEYKDGCRITTAGLTVCSQL